MQLIIHIGTNKTGSSAIQSHMTINKSVLLSKGFWLVESQEDQKMLEGKISAGNGVLLAKHLHDENEIELYDYLYGLKERAKKQGVSSIILSSEVIIRLFSNEKILELLDITAKKVGYDNVKCLCIIRNPLDHALSLYKHRAKSGEWINYDDWFQKNYETLRLFKRFLRHYQKYNLDWIFLEYNSDSSKFLNNFYEKAFQIDLDNEFKELEVRVNTSLQLNTIRILNLTRSQFPKLSYFFYNELIQKKYNKCENEKLLKSFNITALNYFSEYYSTITELNNLVSKEKWIFERIDNNKEVDSNRGLYIELEESHIQFINSILDNHLSLFLKNSIEILKLNISKHFFKSSYDFDQQQYGGNMNFKLKLKKLR